MMQYGILQFSIATAAYQRLERSTSYRWARQAQIGSHDALQFVGYGEDRLELEGVIFPHYRGGAGQLDRMRRQASVGVPLPLVSGYGRFLGVWCCSRISETQDAHLPGGVPLRQEFRMGLERYDGGLRSLLPF